MNLKASAPTTEDKRQYHLHTEKGDIAPFCLLVGDPDRATLIAKKFFSSAELVGDHRGLKSYTGRFRELPVSVVTTGMGSPSLCIVVPEAYDCGARLFIRVGTCGSLIERSNLGDMIIVKNALRLEGTSFNYAPREFPSVAHPLVTAELIAAAEKLYPTRYFTGMEATTDCFREGQGRPNTEDVFTDRARRVNEYVLGKGAVCYSMEASALFVWCATHFGGVPCGAINAVIGNRIIDIWGVKGEEEASLVALEALCGLKDKIQLPI